jgi:hypothetical protein
VVSSHVCEILQYAGILMVAGALSVGYILGLLQQEGLGTSMFSRSVSCATF